MRIYKWVAGTLLLTTIVAQAYAADTYPVGITSDLMSVDMDHNGKTVQIIRNQDNDNTVIDEFAKTSRPCPPFCIQPMIVAEGVETLAELEVIAYIQKVQAGDNSIMLLDSRTPDWVEKGTIPGATNVSWVDLAPSEGATTEGITEVMTNIFGVSIVEGADEFDIDEAIVAGTVAEIFDYSSARTLLLFCNGMWCGQSPVSIRTLLKYGYPAAKLKWYRGGMQAWEILGLSTVKP